MDLLASTKESGSSDILTHCIFYAVVVLELFHNCAHSKIRQNLDMKLSGRFRPRGGTCENFDRDARVIFLGLKFTKMSFFGFR